MPEVTQQASGRAGTYTALCTGGADSCVDSREGTYRGHLGWYRWVAPGFPQGRGALRTPCPTFAAGHPEPQPVHGRHGAEQQEAPHRVHQPQRELHAQQPRPGQGSWNSECPPLPAPGPTPDSRLGLATAVQGVRRPGCDPETLQPPLQPLDAPRPPPGAGCQARGCMVVLVPEWWHDLLTYVIGTYTGTPSSEPLLPS